MTINSNIKYVYPEEFFNIPHPTNPSTIIQFRTEESPAGSLGVTDPSIWSNITFNPNNFFDSLVIEDEGGALSLKLSLKDMNHTFLEEKILKMTQVLKLENIKRRKEAQGITISDPVTEDSVLIKSFSSSQTSIRVRFGYSGRVDENYFSSASFDGFQERISNPEIPVVMSPWIYFIITGMNMNISQEGLSVDIEAVSENFPKLNSLKLINVGLPLRGTAEEIIKMFEMYLKTVVEGLVVEAPDDPLVVVGENSDQELILDLGEFVEGEVRFKTISTLLNDFCKLIHPVYFDGKGENLIPLTSYDDLKNNEEASHRSYNYTWYFYDQDPSNPPVLRFYYRRPNEKQNVIRTYTWIEHGQSVIKEMNVSSEHLFSQLNVPMFSVSKEGNHSLYVLSSDDDEGNTSTKVLSDSLKDDAFSFTFAQDSYYNTAYRENDEEENSGLSKIANLSANLNNALSEGSITIQGDPFFMFDAVMAPFSYIIRLIIRKPTYIDEDGIRVGGGNSYLSGDYVVKKITHELSAGNFVTKLDIMRAL